MRRDVTQEQRGRSHLSLLTIIAEDQWVAKVGVVLTHKLASGTLPKKGKVNTTGGREGGRGGREGGREGREGEGWRGGEVGREGRERGREGREGGEGGRDKGGEPLFVHLCQCSPPSSPCPPPSPLSPLPPSPHLCTSLGSPLSRTQ